MSGETGLLVGIGWGVRWVLRMVVMGFCAGVLYLFMAT